MDLFKVTYGNSRNHVTPVDITKCLVFQTWWKLTREVMNCQVKNLMHEILTILTDVCGVCLSVCLSRGFVSSA